MSATAGDFIDWRGQRGPGVYALIFRERIIYIGQGEDLRARVHYQSKRMDFDRVAYMGFTCRADRLRYEAQMVAKHQPAENIRLKNPPRKTKPVRVVVLVDADTYPILAAASRKVYTKPKTHAAKILADWAATQTQEPA